MHPLQRPTRQWRQRSPAASITPCKPSWKAKADCYEVAEGGTVPEPEPASTLPTTEERLAALEAGQADADALNVDQAYRLTLLELGLTPEA